MARARHAILLLDHEARILSWTRGAEELLATTRSGLDSAPLLSVVGVAEQEAVLRSVRGLSKGEEDADGGRSFTVARRGPGEETELLTLTLLAWPGPLEAGTRVAAHLSTRMYDRVEPKTSDLLEEAIDLLDESIVVAAYEEEEEIPRVVFANRRFSEQTGFPRTDLIGEPLDVVVGPRTSPELLDVLDRAAAGSVRFSDRTTIYDQHGGEILCEINLRPLRSGAEGGGYLLWTQRPIPARPWTRMRNLGSEFDPVTGLPDQGRLLNRLGRSVAWAGVDPDYTYAVVGVDLLEFDVVGERHGDAAAIQLLEAAAWRLSRALRAGDLVCRLGRRALGVLLDHAGAPYQVEALLGRIQEALWGRYRLRGHELDVSGYLGVALSQTGYGQPRDVLAAVDEALGQAGEGARGSYAFADRELQLRSAERAALGHELEAAAERGELALVYQPIYDLDTGRVIACEALLRWEHPERGTLLPDDFLPVAEEFGVMGSLGRWVLSSACHDLAGWQRSLPPDEVPELHVNVSLAELRSDDFPEAMETSIRETGVDPSGLLLEVEERTVATDPDALKRAVARLDRRGLPARLWLDSFGSAGISVSNLVGLPLERVKLDSRLLEEPGGDGGDGNGASLLRGLVGLAGSLQVGTAASRIESAGQLEGLRQSGCAAGQGFYFSEPVGPSAVQELIRPE